MHGACDCIHVKLATSWMRSNRLQLLTRQVACCTTTRRQHQLATSAPPTDSYSISAGTVVVWTGLGTYTDCDLSTRTHVKHTVSSSFRSLRRTSSVSTVTLRCCWWSRWYTRYCMDCCNGVLVDLPAYLIRQFQSLLNAAARLSTV